MSACERCWRDAYWQARNRGTSQADEYRALLTEREADEREVDLCHVFAKKRALDVARTQEGEE